DQDRRLHLGDAQGPQNLETRHVGQVEVEQDYVVVVQLAEIDALFAEIRRIDVEALGFEHQLDRLRRRAVVFDQQHAHANPLLAALGSDRRAAAAASETPWDKSIRNANEEWLTEPDSPTQAFPRRNLTNRRKMLGESRFLDQFPLTSRIK